MLSFRNKHFNKCKCIDWKSDSPYVYMCVCIYNVCWRRKWQPTPVFLPEKSHGQRSLVGYSPWDCRELDTTERWSTIMYVYMHVIDICVWYIHAHIYTYIWYIYERRKVYLAFFFSHFLDIEEVIGFVLWEQ